MLITTRSSMSVKPRWRIEPRIGVYSRSKFVMSSSVLKMRSGPALIELEAVVPVEALNFGCLYGRHLITPSVPVTLPSSSARP